MNERLIGLRVQHRKKHMIGTIISIEGNKMVVSFHGENQMYSFPVAFAQTLELEDEELQKELEGMSTESNFNEFKSLFQYSINDEIVFLKTSARNRQLAIDGERLTTQNGEYLYAFDTDTELHFPDGTPLKLWMGDSIVNAYVVTCEEYTLMIRSMEYLGEFVEHIEFTAEQGALLEALMERLGEMYPETDSIAYEVACGGLSKINRMKHMMYGQDYAFKKAASDPITFIWGPPGTGKTHTLAKIALDAMENGKRVLMLSYSNVSVDGALLRVAHMSDFEDGQVIRYGYPRVKEILESKTLTSYQFVLSQHPELAREYQDLMAEKRKLKRKDKKRLDINKRLNKIREYLLAQEKELIQSSAFVATTVSKAVMDKSIYSQKFDVVIFDEASMAYVPQVVFAAGLAKSNFVCLGDFCQLPAIVQNNADVRLSKDIFEHTGITTAVENEYGHDWLVMLNIQYRMHPDIADFAGKFMYGNRLKTFEKIYDSREEIASCAPLEDTTMGLVDLSFMYSVCTQTMDKSRINLLSAMICVRLAEQYINQYEVGIITPYNAQSRLILAMVRDLQEKDKRFTKITCATVHQFQGSEKPIIIYDAVDCFRMPYPGMLLTTMKNNQANRLFNVALTRAQGKFILVANRDYLIRKNISKNLMFTKALNSMYHSNAFLYGEDAILECTPDEGESPAVYVDDREETWEMFAEDLKSAEKEIKIDLPGVLDENDEAIEELLQYLDDAKERGIDIIIRTTEDITIPKPLRKFVVIFPYVTTPVTIIDKRITWFGQPLTAADFISEGTTLETQYFPCVRFIGIHTARALKAFLGL